MSDIIITPVSGKIDFYQDLGAASLAKIELTSTNDLALSTTSGNIILGDASRDVYIGNGINEVDIIFEQNGEIRPLIGKTLNIGTSGAFTQILASKVNINQNNFTNIPLDVYSSTSGATILNVAGTNGSLFAVTDSLSGSLMSVNNNAGLPIFEVFSDDRVIAGRFNQNDFMITRGGNVVIGTGVPSSKFHVVGTGTFTGDVSSTGSFIAGSGAAGNPSFEFIGDTDTGMFSPAANTIGLSTSGVERLRINNVGNIGIGTITPSGQLHVIGTGIVSSRLGVGTNTPIYDLDIRTNSDNAFYVTQGAGTRYLLLGNNGFINNTTLAVSKTSWGSLASLEVGTTIPSRRGLVIEQVASQTANAIETRDNASNVLSYISSSGAAYFRNGIGVGTTTPASQLHVIGTGIFSSGLFINSIPVSISGHTHTSSEITDFNSSVSGLFPTITNSGDNRLLTSTGSSIGINAENNATFDGSNLGITGSIIIDNLKLDDNTLSSLSGNIIISPSGSGPLQRNSDGNARGSYAIDWQAVRTTGTQVAGGNYSVIGGGLSNSISTSGTSSVIAGGENNSIILEYSAIVGGVGNITKGAESVVVGGSYNTAFGVGSFVGGGTTNIAGTGNNAFYSVVVGGNTNISSRAFSFIGGGTLNTCSGLSSVICGGKSNAISGSYGGILGGQNNKDGGHNNVFILGSNITGTQPNTTYVENFDVALTGDIDTLKINKFYHNNLAVASGFGNNDLLMAIINPTGTATTEVIQGSVLRSSLLNQPAQLQFRQGTNTERLLITPASGEPIWTTDTQQFYIGDGSTVGGDFMGPSPYARSSGTQSIVALNTGCAVTGDYSVVGGGYQNTVNGDGSVIAGGGWYNAGSMQIEANTISGNRSFIGGGANNTITTDVAVICGGRTNSLGGYATLCSILGGYNNSITANVGCSILGGMNNNISGSYSSYNSICGGRDNSMTAGATSAVIGGGAFNTSSGYYSVIGGGTSNTIAGDRYYNTIGGGFSNYIDSQGEHGSTIAGGYNNTISGDYSGGSTIGGGKENNIGAGNTGGYFSTIGGGYGNKITGTNYCTIPGGYFAKATRHGELSHAAGRFSNEGDAQHSTLIARKTTTTNTANQVLFLDDNSLRLTIPAKTTWTFEVKLSAYNDTDSAGAGWIFRGAIRRNGANGTALIGTVVTESWQDSAMSSTSASVVADDTNEALEIRVTGLASKNIRWVAVVDISQVSYGTP